MNFPVIISLLSITIFNSPNIEISTLTIVPLPKLLQIPRKNKNLNQLILITILYLVQHVQYSFHLKNY